MKKHCIKGIISLLRQIDSLAILNYIRIIIEDIHKEAKGGGRHE